MEKPDWGPRLVKVIAGQIRHYREQRSPKMSTQGLADRCAELGWPIKRSVLSNLELGYRETITVPELFVIAEALEVPLLLLLLPLGHADKAEVLPGEEVDIRRALNWLRGDAKLKLGRPDWKWRAVGWFVEHQRQVRILEDSKATEREADQARQYLRDLRATMRDHGLTPPAVPSRLRVDEEGVS